MEDFSWSDEHAAYDDALFEEYYSGSQRMDGEYGLKECRQQPHDEIAIAPFLKRCLSCRRCYEAVGVKQNGQYVVEVKTGNYELRKQSGKPEHSS
ncbi:hypothetical protein Tcan_10554 [Toxocara canis]|uniref:Uncharacterized protein n=1 Tax=Toxocara canis TaxID=6265 RepID=A0A0B2V4I7_TOXCA|nr:hypothetical protein Tcan_10554 [Toxocara canis]